MLLTRKINLRYFFIYLGVTAFSVLFTIIYYMNSYGMTDNHLTYLFVPSLITALIFLLFFIFKYSLCDEARYIWNMAFPFIYVYIMLNGIYTIAKTSSDWLFIFVILFSIGVAISLIVEVVSKIKGRKKQSY